jgi:hypothetical protein
MSASLVFTLMGDAAAFQGTKLAQIVAALEFRPPPRSVV